MVVIFVIIRTIPLRLVRFIIADSSLSLILVVVDANGNVHRTVLPAIVLIGDMEIRG